MRTLLFNYSGTFPIKLVQLSKDTFEVTYGKQVRTGNYEAAARELGQAIMHSLGCEGKLLSD